MTVNAQKGRDFRLQVKVSGSYYFLDGETSLSGTIGQEAVGVNDKPKEWRELLPECGLRTATVKADGLVRTGDLVSVFQELRRCAMLGDPVEFQIATGGAGDDAIYIGSTGIVTSFERSGDSHDAEKYSISIESITVVTIGGEVDTVVETPVISPAGGSITTADLISITCATAGVSIWYTIDGSTPTTSSTPYTAPFVLSAGSVTVKTFATKSGLTDSAVASATFTVSTAFILAFGANPVRAKAASTYADLYTTASISGDAWDAPLYVPERNAAYMPRGNGSIGKFAVGGYSTISAQSGNTARGIGRVGNVLVAQWLVSFGSNPMARSTDYGDTWSAFTGPLATSGQAYGVGMCASSSQFITIGTLLTGGAPVFSTSPDGVTWTTGNLPDAGQTGQAYYVQAIGNVAICVGIRASGALRVHYSTDGGLTWANASTLDGAASTAPGTPFAAGGRFYLGLSTGGYYYSSDGSAWTAMPAPPTGSITAAMGGVGTEMWFDTSSGIRSYSPENGWSAVKATESGYLYAGVYG